MCLSKLPMLLFNCVDFCDKTCTFHVNYKENTFQFVMFHNLTGFISKTVKYYHRFQVNSNVKIWKKGFCVIKIYHRPPRDTPWLRNFTLFIILNVNSKKNACITISQSYWNQLVRLCKMLSQLSEISWNYWKL